MKIGLKKKNFRVLTRKTAPPTGCYVFQPTSTILEHSRDIIRTNVLTEYHEDWTKNKNSRVLTRKSAPPPGGHVFQLTRTIFKLSGDIIGTNDLTQVLLSNIIRTNLLTKFHKDQTINVASRVVTRRNVDDERRTTDNW
ncbi:hypothetical protein DPMN_153044 [Dreissena polymorpha]|uniref:Uncharacterized protein n=1 Tax=Dreissena polymorpha TaxID=45954 RepID=A0A9D4FMF6_DREPO|nr:hypothetical protein DPMN_153044 [Dreissena polymorpha]